MTDLPRWENPEKQKDPITWFGPVLAGDRLVVAGTNSEALAVSPYTGEILGRQTLSGAASLGADRGRRHGVRGDRRRQAAGAALRRMAVT